MLASPGETYGTSRSTVPFILIPRRPHPALTRADKGLTMFPQESDTIPPVLISESHLLELISTGAPLPEVLSTICAALDVQVGNVVSVVLSLSENQHSLNALAEQAAQFGLYVFSCCAILSKSGQLLGTLETYSCLLRNPAVNEARLIQRASQLAALAILRFYPERDRWIFSSSWAGASERSSPDGPASEN